MGKLGGCFVDLLFPSTCIGCNIEGEILCDDCLKLIPFESLQVCPICEQTITVSGALCTLCKNNSIAPLKRLVVAASYQDQLLPKAIHFYKYKFVHELATPLGKILEKALLSLNVPAPDVIVPVPLHPRRLRWRGFNQAKLLADHLSINLVPHLLLPVEENILVRTRNTSSQLKVKNYSSRLENISGAFSIDPKHDSSSITRNHVLLVDDVCTTGATILECAKELQTLGPKSITAVVLARQGYA